MTSVMIECLCCGRTRRAGGPLDHPTEAGACPRCGYVGWASSHDLTEDERRELRELPVERRRFEPAGMVSFR
jgi:hypothetical protein